MPIQRRRLLIVNNDERESTMLMNLAKSMGYEAISTWSGRDALWTLSADQFDLLLVDHYLADMYVGDFINRVHLSPSRPSIILMTNRMGTPVKYDKSLGKCRAFEKDGFGKLVQELRTEALRGVVKSTESVAALSIT